MKTFAFFPAPWMFSCLPGDTSTCCLLYPLCLSATAPWTTRKRSKVGAGELGTLTWQKAPWASPSGRREKLRQLCVSVHRGARGSFVKQTLGQAEKTNETGEPLPKYQSCPAPRQSSSDPVPCSCGLALMSELGALDLPHVGSDWRREAPDREFSQDEGLGPHVLGEALFSSHCCHVQLRHCGPNTLLCSVTWVAKGQLRFGTLLPLSSPADLDVLVHQGSEPSDGSI